MEDTAEVEVKITSREAVKPSSPTPSHLQTFTLGYVNQIMPLVPLFPSCGLVFYSTPSEKQPVNISLLKACLSQTLAKFYPLAGRVSKSSVHCNDEGIPFIEAKVNCSLSSILHSTRKLELLTKFLPPTESLGMGDQLVLELTHLAIQISVFTCGGVAIGWYDIHKVLDGISAVTFFKHWAALASQRYEDIVQPDFDACVAAFPSSSKLLQLPVVNVYKEDVVRSPTVAKSFIFRNTAIHELKVRAGSEQVPKPTSFQAIAGFLWEQVLAVSKTAATDSVLHVTLDVRPRTHPPLPTGSIGNLAVITVARAEKQHAKLPFLVAEINSAVSITKEEIKKYQRENGIEAVMENWSKVVNSIVDCKDTAYRLISWCKLGFSNLDFGFGKPKCMIPTDGRLTPFHRNMMILNDYADSDGEGIEAWLFLEEKEMQILESNQDFLDFASPLH